MCQLRGHVHPALEKRWHGTLPLQRLRTLPQDERHQPALVQTPEEAGKSRSCSTCGAKLCARVRLKDLGKCQGCFDSLGPHVPSLGGPDFQNKTDCLVFSRFQDLEVARPVLQTPRTGSGRGCRTQGQNHGASLSKASLCFSISVDKLAFSAPSHY